MARRQPAKDLMVGEMFFQGDEGMFHAYWEVIGHKHEEKRVLARRIYGDVEHPPNWTKNPNDKSTWDYKEVDYDESVAVRPEAPMFAREDFRKTAWAYRRWPYDSKGNFSFTPLDWSDGPPH